MEQKTWIFISCTVMARCSPKMSPLSEIAARSAALFTYYSTATLFAHFKGVFCDAASGRDGTFGLLRMKARIQKPGGF